MSDHCIRAKELYAKIEANTHDDEVAHAHEDELLQLLVDALLDGASRDDLLFIARLAKRARALEFARWCA